MEQPADATAPATKGATSSNIPKTNKVARALVAPEALPRELTASDVWSGADPSTPLIAEGITL